MKINFNTISYNSPVKTLYITNVKYAAFKSQEMGDIFVKSSKKPEKVEEKIKEESILPEYLYHLTNKKSYESIMNSGEIKPSEDIIDGVFMFDMEDFQVNWTNCSSNENLPSFAKSLLKQAIKYDNDLVLIKISTNNLDPNKFRIRPQDDVTNFINSNKYRNLCMVYAESGGPFKHKYEFPKDLVEGYSIAEAQRFFNQKRPVEYIYQGNIKIEPQRITKVLHIPDITYNSIEHSKTEFIEGIFERFKNFAEK